MLLGHLCAVSSDTMMRSGDIEMQGKSEEIRFMTMEVSIKLTQVA